MVLGCQILKRQGVQLRDNGVPEQAKQQQYQAKPNEIDIDQ